MYICMQLARWLGPLHATISRLMGAQAHINLSSLVHSCTASANLHFPAALERTAKMSVVSRVYPLITQSSRFFLNLLHGCFAWHKCIVCCQKQEHCTNVTDVQGVYCRFWSTAVSVCAGTLAWIHRRWQKYYQIILHPCHDMSCMALYVCSFHAFYFFLYRVATTARRARST